LLLRNPGKVPVQLIRNTGAIRNKKNGNILYFEFATPRETR